MKIVITINQSENKIKRALAKAWNKRFGENITEDDIREVINKEEILSAIAYLNNDNTEVIVDGVEAS